jgi:predicted dehydrogenase
MSNKPVRAVAVVGAGSIGYRHLRNLKQLGIENLSVYEPGSERRAQLQADHPGWKWMGEFSDLLDDRPDAIIVASPSAYHEEHAEAALVRGYALFVEKPLSYRIGRLPEIVKLAASKNLVTMVACNMRFHPGPATLHRLLKEGVIGKLISYRLHFGSSLPGWRPYHDYRKSYSASVETGGAILDCIHELDLAVWYSGPAELVAAKHVPAQPIGLETDGLAEILLEHQTGVLGSIHLNFIERDYRRYGVFIGTEGTLEWDFHQPEVKQYRSGRDDIVIHPLPDGWVLNDMYVDEMRYFLDCVREKKQTNNSIAESLASLRLALQARASTR